MAKRNFCHYVFIKNNLLNIGMDIGHSPRSKKQRTRLPDVVPVITLKYGI